MLGFAKPALIIALRFLQAPHNAGTGSLWDMDKNEFIMCIDNHYTTLPNLATRLN
jgi:hypothetical protein